MNGKHEIELAGCTPEPLLNYLKALGVIRLVAEQKDAGALACWRRDRLCLISILDRNDLIKFFLDEYRPTPIIGPWAGGSGFYSSDDQTAVQAIQDSTNPRFSDYSQAIRMARSILTHLGIEEPPKDELKSDLLGRFRQSLPDAFVDWMDAVLVLGEDSPEYAPLLGTGGNDGRLNFSQNFMQRLVELGLNGGSPQPEVEPLLRQSVFGHRMPGLHRRPVGQFAPGRAGGPNATQGMEGEPLDNPWDFILGIEGSLVLAGAAVRRLGLGFAGRAAFPFTIDTRVVGDEASTDAKPRGELWLPLWDRPATYQELRLLFAEARAEWRRRAARDPVDFARAVASLGIDRGIRSFTRYSFVQRSGKAYLAAWLHRFPVPDRPRAGMRLLADLDSWLPQLRNFGDKGPGELQVACRQLENAIFNYCRYGRREDLQQILVALGQAEQAVALRASRNQEQEEVPIAPFRSLSSQWVAEADDGSDAYRLALAIASIHQHYPAGESQRQSLQPLRANLEPVEYDKGRWKWKPMSPSVAWQPGPLARNLAAILERRLLEASNVASPELPLASRYGVDLDVVAWWLADDSADRRIAELIPGLALVDYSQPIQLKQAPKGLEDTPPLPRAYALLKLLFLPHPLVPPSPDRPYWRLAGPNEQGIRIKPEMRILALLRAGRIEEACQVAYRRLRASGLVPLPGPQASRPVRERDWLETAGLDPQRLAAALLIPITPAAVHAAASLVLRPPKELPPEPGRPAASFEDSSANEFIAAF